MSTRSRTFQIALVLTSFLFQSPAAVAGATRCLSGLSEAVFSTESKESRISQDFHAYVDRIGDTRRPTFVFTYVWSNAELGAKYAGLSVEFTESNGELMFNPESLDRISNALSGSEVVGEGRSDSVGEQREIRKNRNERIINEFLSPIRSYFGGVARACGNTGKSNTILAIPIKGCRIERTYKGDIEYVTVEREMDAVQLVRQQVTTALVDSGQSAGDVDDEKIRSLDPKASLIFELQFSTDDSRMISLESSFVQSSRILGIQEKTSIREVPCAVSSR